jgi:hypothetical protein
MYVRVRSDSTAAVFSESRYRYVYTAAEYTTAVFGVTVSVRVHSSCFAQSAYSVSIRKEIDGTCTQQLWTQQLWTQQLFSESSEMGGKTKLTTVVGGSNGLNVAASELIGKRLTCYGDPSDTNIVNQAERDASRYPIRTAVGTPGPLLCPLIILCRCDSPRRWWMFCCERCGVFGRRKPWPV